VTGAAGRLAAPGGAMPAGDLRLVRWQIGIALAAVAVGITVGLFQALDRIGIDVYPHLPFLRNYYQGLTLHGVFNVLVFTFGFTNGFLLLVHVRAVGLPPVRGLTVAATVLLGLGAVLTGVEILANRASVLFTMYPPLEASPVYYLGATLLVLSTWAAGANVFVLYRRWRRAHAGEETPLQAYMVVATYAMWLLASIGIAVEVLGLLLPWSLGWMERTDPQLARVLFWFSGHPIVYFWLLPAYVSWYTMIPAQVGGRLFSDPLARLVFLLFLIFSIPTGFHHQYTDPGIAHGYKLVHLFTTFAVFYPSFMTAFSVGAALESGGRARGGSGLLGWFWRLPWGDPSVVAQLLAMLAFTLGGVSGLVNASYNVNLVVHNSAWVPGHFHLTVGAAVALTFFGICYWLVPRLWGRTLVARRLALAQAWLWFVGVMTFSRGQIDGGLEGLPRRLHVSLLPYQMDAWQWSHALTAIGGSLMFLSGVCFFTVMLATVFAGARAPVRDDVPVAVPRRGETPSWRWLERWGLWIGVTLVLIAIAYGPFLVSYGAPELVSQGMRVW
jgi:cytochrome c oxidase subunit 1